VRNGGSAWVLLSVAFVCAAPSVAEALAAEAPAPESDPEAAMATAPVEVDGRELFRVRGTSSYPAARRAAAIAERIRALAADASVPAEVAAEEVDEGTAIVAGGRRLMLVFDADAQLESLDRETLALVIAPTVREAVVDYRRSRSRETLVRNTGLALAATAILAALAALVLWLARRWQAVLERRYRRRIQSVGIGSFRIVQAEQIWNALRRTLGGARTLVLLVLAFVYLQYVLGLYPWTRGTANRMLGYALDPLAAIGRGIVGAIPDLLFLAVLFLVTRLALKFIHLLFAAAGRREVALPGFEPEWAEPTYKLLRIVVVVLALVVAYPYIPGSDSEAFKGISIFAGVVFSLGATSAIANMIAGYALIYRRAFKLGERVKIGATIGDVTEMRLQVTHLKTIKNEEVIVPNSIVLNNEVVNYSSLARRGGLILHTTVGIGYETPWRQVEAMLLLAAERTPGIMEEPRPFVQQQALGDFAVTYEINVYTDDAKAMHAIYTDLHRNILDVFNEHGVQIMTPAYEGDPEVPKVVPREQWYLAPARAAEEEGR